MKKAQLIIYTRNRDVDYRMVITPDESVCPSDTRKYFRKIIRGAVDIESYDDPISEPRWLYAKKGNVILFGVATTLDVFDPENCVDFTGRKVRGFYGIVIDSASDKITLPYDLSFFKAINEQYIAPLWFSSKDEFIRKGIEIDMDDFDINNYVSADREIELNVNPDDCLILGKIEIISALRSALSYINDISLVSGFNNRQHAFAIESDYSFMNAIVNGVHEKEQRVTAKKPADIITPPMPETPKKAIRPKAIVAVLLILTALLVISLGKSCSNKQMSQDSSTSGVQIIDNPADTTMRN